MSDRQRTVTTTAGDRLPVSRAVLEVVAAATERDVTELAPLYEAVDPESLDELFEPRPSGDCGPLGLLFEYAGRRVTVERDADGAVTVAVSATAGTE